MEIMLIIMRNKKIKHSDGFTLIELMISVAIIGTLAAVAYPSYVDHVANSNRSEATSELVSLASAQERFYTLNNTYGNNADFGLPTLSETGLYTLSVNAGAGITYTLTAVPTWVDVPCDDFTLTNTGLKGVTGGDGVANCWR
jgi:type IV pilus assembly protein PilE